jgi:hypothetical protein
MYTYCFIYLLLLHHCKPKSRVLDHQRLSELTSILHLESEMSLALYHWHTENLLGMTSQLFLGTLMFYDASVKIVELSFHSKEHC